MPLALNVFIIDVFVRLCAIWTKTQQYFEKLQMVYLFLNMMATPDYLAVKQFMYFQVCYQTHIFQHEHKDMVQTHAQSMSGIKGNAYQTPTIYNNQIARK